MDISVLIITCDHYNHLWEGTGLSWTLLSGLEDLDLYVVSDNKLFDYEHKSFIPLSLNKPNYTKNDFSNKVIYALDQIPTKYVLFIDEDMWPERSIKRLMPKFIDFMEETDADALQIHEKLSWWDYSFDSTDIFIDGERVLKMKQDSSYLLSHNAVIWNKEYFKSIQIPDEDAWENEIQGSIRAQKKLHNIYHYNVRWYIQWIKQYKDTNTHEAFIDDLRYKKEFNKKFNIKK